MKPTLLKQAEIKRLWKAGVSSKTVPMLIVGEVDAELWASDKYGLMPAARFAPLFDASNLEVAPGVYELLGAQMRKREGAEPVDLQRFLTEYRAAEERRILGVVKPKRFSTKSPLTYFFSAEGKLCLFVEREDGVVFGLDTRLLHLVFGEFWQREVADSESVKMSQDLTYGLGKPVVVEHRFESGSYVQQSPFKNVVNYATSTSVHIAVKVPESG